MARNKTSIGIEVSFNVIRVVQYTILGKIVSKSYFPEIGINRVQFLDFIRTSVADFLKENKLTSVSLNFSISYDENNGKIGFITIPKLDKKNSQKAMKYEIQDKNSEDNLENFHVLTEKLGQSVNADKVTYATALIKKDLIESLSRLKKVSWNIESIEMRPVTIGRMIDDTTIVIDYGRKNTFLYYYKNGTLVDVSPIPSGWIRINEIIEEIHPTATFSEMEMVKNQIFLFDDSANYNISPDVWSNDGQDAEININDLSNLESGFDKDELMEISVRTTQEIKYITEEIKRLLRAFELSEDVSVANMYFTGDTANFNDFLRLFSEELDINTLPLSTVLLSKNKEVDVEDSIIAAMATMHSAEKYFKSLNFSKYARNNYDIGSLFVAVLILGVILHGGLVHIHGLYDERAKIVSTELSKVEGERNSIQSQINSLLMEEESSTDISTWLSRIDTERIWLSEFFYHLPSITPNGVAFSKITVQNGLITLRGYAKNYSNVGFLAMEMEKLGGIVIEELSRGQSDSSGEGTGTSSTSVVIENIMTDGKEESFNSNNSFTLKIKAGFPLATYEN